MLSNLYFSHRSTINLSVEHRIPMFGPLDIKKPETFLKESKEFFREWSSSPFPYKLNLNNFQPLYDLGMGAFGKVILVRYKSFDKSYYAMKIMSKKAIIESNITEFALNEKRVLQGLNSPFCIRLEYFTSDDCKLYYLLPFIAGGELFGLIRKLGQLGENLAKFYAAQMVLALEFLHYCDIIHRDLKPENILIDHFGYVKIADFGFAKELNNKTRAYTFCGTPDYIAPEVILGNPYSFAVDWWALGVMSFEMVRGQSPFHDEDHLTTYNKIVEGQYSMPSEFSDELQDLVTRLLQSDLTRRLGNLKGGVREIKQHKWFSEISWLNLLNRRIIPPYIPNSLGDFDTANFPHLKKLPSNFTFTSTSIADSDNNLFKDF